MFMLDFYNTGPFFHKVIKIKKKTCKGDFPGGLVIKNPLANTGDPGSIPGLGRSSGEWIGHPPQYSWAFPGGSDGKQFTCNAGDLGSIPGLGRSPRGWHGNSPQYSCLENPRDRGPWWPMGSQRVRYD